MKAYQQILFVLFLPLSLVSCNNQEPIEEQTLAQIKDLSVSEDHFLAAFKEYYYRTGQSISPDFSTKKEILESEFETYVLATHARDLELDASVEGEREFGMIVRKVYTEEYLEREILSGIEVTEKDMREVFVRVNTAIEVSHLYSRTEQEANSLYEELQSGVSFEELAKQVFQNPNLANNGGFLGSFQVDEMDPAFEIVAHNLEVGQYSTPVKTAQGYSIIRVESKSRKPIITEYEYASKKQYLEFVASSQKMELATREHVQQIENAIEIDSEVSERVWESIESNYNQFISGNTEIGDNELKSEAIASLNGLKISAGDFYAEAYYNSDRVLNNVRDFESYETFLKGIVYRLYLLDSVQREDWIESYEVQASIDETFNVYLANKAVEALIPSISITETELLQAYNAERERYIKPVQLRLARVVLDTEERAEEVIDEIVDGLPFKEAVQQYTLNNEERLTDGDLGWQAATSFGLMAPTLSKLIEGEVSTPIQYQNGEYHIYLCIEKQEMAQLSFVEARNNVEAVLMRKKLSELRAKTIEEVKKKHNAYIDFEKLDELTIQI